MEIKSLRSFVSVAENLSFSAAAKQLHTVQPAVSRHIAQLEHELGVSLFSRNSREVLMTSAGKQLLNESQNILKLIEQAKINTKRAAKGEVGTLKVAHMPSACLPFMAKLVNRFINRFPEVTVNLYEMTVTEQLNAFKENRIDIGFSRPLPSSLKNEFISEEIYRDKLVVVVNHQHALATKESVDLIDLQQEEFIVFNREEAVQLFDETIRICNDAGFSPKIVSQPRHMQTLLTEVASGLGVGIGPYCIRKQYSADCHFLTINSINNIIPLQLHYKRFHQEATVESFVDIALESQLEIVESMEN